MDYSSKAVDIVLLDETTDAATWHRFELHGHDAFDRARDVANRVPGRFHTFWDGVAAVGIEQPRGHHGVVHIARVQGAVLACIPAHKLVQPWNPSSWRKCVGLPGNADKEQIAVWAREEMFRSSYGGFGYVEWSQDGYDAYAIARATRSLLEIGEAA